MRTQVRQYHIKFEARNVSGTWVNVSQFVQGISLQAGLDNPVVTATFSLLKIANGVSAAPLMVGSTLNRDDLSAYAPLFNPGNRVRLHVAVLAPGVAPVSGDWHHLFEGKIDRPDWAPRTTMTVTARDLGAYLLDNVIDVKRQYSTDSGMFVEQVMQQLILDNDATDELVTPDPPDPAWVITKYEQLEDVPVLTAIRDLAGQIAWDVRYDYLPDENVPKLLFYEPDRAKTVADDSFTASEYKDVPTMGFDDEGVRNDIILWFQDRSLGGKWSSRRAKHPGSIAAFGRRFMQFVENAIGSTAEADRELTAVLLDLAVPYIDHSIVTKLWWPCQLGDLYAFPANNNHFDEEQQFAVVAYQHEFAVINNVFTADTTITLRGQPSGGYRRWLEKAGPPGIDPTGLPAPTFGELLGEESSLGGLTGDGRCWWDVEFDDNTEFIKIWAEESEDPNVPNPDVGSEVETSWTIFRPEGTEGTDRRFRTTMPMAIRPGFYARFAGAGYNKSNVMGALWTPDPIQAIDNDPPFVDGEILNFTVTPRDLQDGYVLSIEVGNIDPTTESWLFVERDQIVVFRIPLGTEGNRTITLLDLGLLPGTSRTYMPYVWTRGQSGLPYGWTVGPRKPTDVGPRFSLNSPRLVSGPAGKFLEVDWECEDPLANAVELQRSPDQVTWAIMDTDAMSVPGTVIGTFFLGDISPAYYRLVSKSGTVYLTYTLPKFFPGDQTLPGGPDDSPPVLSKIIRLYTGFPHLIIAWRCDNSDADALILEQSDVGAGVWSELMTTGAIAEGEWDAAPFTFMAKDYRMRAIRFVDMATIATSDILSYDGFL